MCHNRIGRLLNLGVHQPDGVPGGPGHVPSHLHLDLKLLQGLPIHLEGPLPELLAPDELDPLVTPLDLNLPVEQGVHGGSWQ